MIKRTSKVDLLQGFIEKMFDEIISHDLTKLKLRVYKFKLKYRKLPRQQIAKNIVNDQSFWGGILAAPGGLGGMFTLPVSIPADLIKTLRVQSYWY